MTRRLYHEDAWLTRFDARVTAVREDAGSFLVCLDRTAFYPEGGGQPCDTGTLRACETLVRVTDVQKDGAGDVWHRCDAALPLGSPVSGEIDWPRRFDHMQQHTGEHILANCAFRLLGGFTHGLHIGREASSIDVTLPSGRTALAPQEMDALEEMANGFVARDDGVACRVLEGEELAAAALRKEPAVDRDVRVCRIGDYEAVACGGTHLAHASQVGLILLLSTQSARGKLRLFFLCGKRAMDYARLCRRTVAQAGELLSARAEEVPDAVRALRQKSADSAHEAAMLRRERALAQATSLLESAAPIPGGLLAAARLDTRDAPFLTDVAGELVSRPGVVALLCAPQGDGEACVLARSPDRGEDMVSLLRQAGARGGGRPDFARGLASDPDTLERATALLTGGSTHVDGRRP